MADRTTLIKVSTEAAESFTNAYYSALSAPHPPSRRAPSTSISQFYCPRTSLPDGKSVPTIIWNGNVVDDPATLQDIFHPRLQPNQQQHDDASHHQDKTGPATRVRIDVQSLDCHVLNATYNGRPAGKSFREVEKHISVLVQVSGSMRVERELLLDRGGVGGVVGGGGRGGAGPLKAFSETFVLVPNVEKMSDGRGAMAGRRSFLIQSQNFRYVV